MSLPGYGIRNVLTAAISAPENATTELVAAVTGKRIIVLSAAFAAAGVTQTVTFKSAATGITGAMTFSPGIPVVWPESEYGYMETVAGEALNVTLANVASAGIYGFLRYVLED